MKISVLISSYMRPHLLKWGLYSMARQNPPCELEVVVVNDGVKDETESVCNMYRDKLNIVYLFSGQRNANGPIWRGPCVAYNIAAKASTGNAIILSCAEMYSINNSITHMHNTIVAHPRARVTTRGCDDHGPVFQHLEATGGEIQDNNIVAKNTGNLWEHLPFFMGMPRSAYMDIGGYDEDFAEREGYDDDDIMKRLEQYGLTLVKSGAYVCHLYHKRTNTLYDWKPNPKTNYELLMSRRGTMKRNQGREWGVIR